MQTEERIADRHEENIPKHLKDILAPLAAVDLAAQRPGVPSDYSRQLKDLVEMHQRFRGCENLFAKAYAQVSALEKDIASYQENWQNGTPAS